eukprot:Opistho-2@24352
MSGPTAVELPSIDTQIGAILADDGYVQVGMRYLTLARDTQEALYGKLSLTHAASNRQIAKALLNEGDYKGALACEKAAYTVFEAKLGKDDPRTKQSEILLQYYTRSAVDKQMQIAHRQEEENVQKRKKLGGEKVVALSADGSDQRSISDLLDFIEGNEPRRHKGKISRAGAVPAPVVGGRRVSVARVAGQSDATAAGGKSTAKQAGAKAHN